MKRVALLGLALLLVACISGAQQYPVDLTIAVDELAPVVDVSWTAVIAGTDGTPYLPTDTILYDLFTRDAVPAMDDQNLANIIYAGSVSTTSGVVDFTAYVRGWYYVGVRTVVDDGLGTIKTSLIAWSYDPVYVDPTQRWLYTVGGEIPDPPPPDSVHPGM